MAARTLGFSLHLSDIRYTLSHNISISFLHVTGPLDSVLYERVTHPV